MSFIFYNLNKIKFHKFILKFLGKTFFTPFFLINLVLNQFLYSQDSFNPTYPFEQVDPTGLPYQIILSDLQVNGISIINQAEIGIFEGELCVGSGIYDQGNSIVAWEGDPSQGLDGFSNGSQISIYVYHYLFNEWLVSKADIVPLVGDGTFGYGSYSAFDLSIETQNFPNLSVSKELFDFGNVEIGESSIDSITLYNNGDAILEIFSINITNYHFTYTGQLGLINPGDSLEFDLNFFPDNAILENGTLQIFSDDPDLPTAEYTLYGQGLPVSQPELNLSINNIDYGSVYLGNNSIKQVELINDGIEDLVISSFSLNNESSPFSIEETSFTLIPGERYILNINFLPQNEGFYSSELQIESNSAYGTETIYLSGSGYDGHFSPVPSTGTPYTIIINEINLDNHDLSDGDEIAVFDISHSSGQEVCVGSMVFQSNNYPLQLVAWKADDGYGLNGFEVGNDIEIRLWGSTYGTTLELETELSWIEGDGTFGYGGFSVVDIQSMSGLEPIIALSRNLISFPETNLGQTSEESFFVKNIGASELFVSNIFLENNSFSSSHSNFSVLSNDSLEVTITFIPYDPLPSFSNLIIQTQDPNVIEKSIQLNGQGIPADEGKLQVLNSHITFPPTIIGDTSSVDLILFNSGAGPLNIFWVQFENNSFLSGTEESFIIESGQTINVPLYFTPDDEVREYISSLTIYNDGSGEQNFIIFVHIRTAGGPLRRKRRGGHTHARGAPPCRLNTESSRETLPRAVLVRCTARLLCIVYTGDMAWTLKIKIFFMLVH